MDEDWDDDFGGFEGATPVPPELAQQNQAAGIEAASSLWATFTYAAAQPDLLQAQVQSPPVPKPVPPTPFDDPIPQGVHTPSPPEGDAGASENKSSNDLPESDRVQRIQSESLDSIDVSLDDDLEEHNLFSSQPTQRLNILQELPQTESASSIAIPQPEISQVEAPDGEINHGSLAAGNTPASVEVEEKVTNLEEALSVADMEQRSLIRQKEVLMEKVTNLERQVQNMTEALKTQRRKYEEIQELHKAQLEEMRKAGHDTLAIMVEEYKELCRCAVLQQQETSQKLLSSVVAKEAANCEELLKKQQEIMTSVLEEERKKNEDRLKQALEKYSVLHRSKLESLIDEERQRSVKAQEEVTKNYEKELQEAVVKAVEAERSRGQSLMEMQRSELRASAEEERKQNTKMFEKDLDEERQRSKEAIQLAFVEERDLHQDAVKGAIRTAQEEMKEAFEEQRKEEASSQRRSLATMDLFLRGVQEQLKLLMDPTKDGPHPTSSLIDRPKTDHTLPYSSLPDA